MSGVASGMATLTQVSRLDYMMLHNLEDGLLQSILLFLGKTGTPDEPAGTVWMGRSEKDRSWPASEGDRSIAPL
jgi:hypothetical protein